MTFPVSLSKRYKKTIYTSATVRNSFINKEEQTIKLQRTGVTTHRFFFVVGSSETRLYFLILIRRWVFHPVILTTKGRKNLVYGFIEFPRRFALSGWQLPSLVEGTGEGPKKPLGHVTGRFLPEKRRLPTLPLCRQYHRRGRA